MSEIYKINHVINNEIKKIFIFTGSYIVASEKDNPTINGEKIFTSLEWTNISENNISIVFIKNKYIHGDDTILRIKEKILKECKGLNSSTLEMYLFSIQKIKFNIANIFYKLTQKETLDLNGERLKQFLYNILSSNKSLTNKTRFFKQKHNIQKDIYSYDDFNNLNIDWDENIIVTNPIGQRISKNGRFYPFIANPYNNNITDQILNHEGQNMIHTLNAYLLFKYFPLENNNIYLCLAKDVVSFASENSLNDEYFLKLYFPHLYNREKVTNAAELKSKGLRIYDREKNVIKKYYDAYNNRVDIFYDIDNSTKNLDYTEIGVASIYATIHPENYIKLPLEVLFKIIHSSSNIPLIKYNPGKKYENIYRLYTNDYVSVSGIKVPSLYVSSGNRKTKINQISKILSTKHSVGFFIEHSYKNKQFEILCEFYENGNIEIKLDCPILLDINDINIIIRDAISKTILSKIGSYLKQSGYEYIIFNNLGDKNIEINNLDFKFKLENKKRLDISKYIGCISAIFNIIKGKAVSTADIINLVYKRVSLFKLMDSIKSFITIQRQNGVMKDDLVDNLMENFTKEIPDEDRALELIAEWQDEIQMKADAYGNKNRIIDSNPGFETNIHTEVSIENTFVIVTINNINDIKYIPYIKIYINSILKLLRKTKFKEKISKKVVAICEKTSKKQTKKMEIRDEDIDIKPQKPSGKIIYQEKEEDVVEYEDDDDIFEREETDDEDEDEDTEEEEEEEEHPSLAMPLLSVKSQSSVISEEGSEKLEEKSKEKVAVGSPGSILSDESPTPVAEAAIEAEVVDSPGSILSDESPTPVAKATIEAEVVDSPGSILSDGDTPKDLSLLKESLDSDSDSDSDDDSDVDSTEGGGKRPDSGDEMDIDLSHLALSGAKNIFMLRLRERDPEIFLKKDSQGYKSYSRSCPFQYRKQPIILTDKEKAYIDTRDHESGIKSYDESIRYGSGEQKYNYICPRFWCIRDDKGKGRSLSVKQINEGECGGWDALIPERAKKVPKGKRIVEFTDERFHREGAKNTKPGDPARKLIYRPLYPSFQNPSKHPKGLCVPCCYQQPGTDKNAGKALPHMYKPTPKPTFKEDKFNNIKLDTIKGQSQIRPRSVSERADVNLMCNEFKESTKSKQKKKSVVKKIDDTPLMSFPLKRNQLGYMSLSLQKFFSFDNASICYHEQGMSYTNHKLNTRASCLVRIGIEKNKNQSFLCLLASVYKYYNKALISEKLNNIPVASLIEFKSYFLKNLTIEKFVMVQNGILPTIFEVEKKVKISKYKSEKYIKSINNKKFKKKIIGAYENFINYFNDENEVIDYTYIWDLVCRPMNKGGVLFEDGINMLILNSPNNDITDKIQLICPTNHFSDDFFDQEKKTLMIYSRNGYFEPLCKIKKLKTSGINYHIARFLSARDFNVFKDNSNIINIIAKIRELLLKNCTAKNSMSKKKYKYTRNINVEQLVIELNKLDYILNSQLLNYNNQVIGLIVSKKLSKLQFYLPCLPSGINFKYPYAFVQTFNNYEDYDKTRAFLDELYVISKKKIPCKPIKKIIDDNMLVGIITITNQFVPIKPERYIEEVSEDMEVEFVSKLNNFLKNDQKLLQDTSIDEERNIMVKKIELENNFYNLFRNTLKIIINYKEKSEDKSSILNIVNDITITYLDKISKIRDILHRVLNPVIKFQKIVLDTIEEYEDLITCLGLNRRDCKKEVHCFLRQENGECKLIIPRKNLFNEMNNKRNYFLRLTDEIIRYSKIRKYLFTPRSFLSFERVNYKINKNEIILLEEILLDKYLDNIKLRNTNKYIKTTKIYEIADPSHHVPYKNTYRITDDITEKETICTIQPQSMMPYGHATLKALFKTKVNKDQITVNQYLNSSNCVFEMIKFVLEDSLGRPFSILQIKNKLIDGYLSVYNTKIPTILKKKGNRNRTLFSLFNYWTYQRDAAQAVDNVFEDSETKEEIRKQILLENYYPTEFDILLLFSSYNIPVLLRMKGNQHTLLANKLLMNISTTGKDYSYIIIIDRRRLKRDKKMDYGLLSLDRIGYKISNKLINKPSLLTRQTTPANYIKESLKYLKTRIEVERKLDRERKRKKKGAKKIGRKILSSK